MTYRHLFIVLTLAGSAAALGGGCAETPIDIGTFLDDGGGAPGFTNLDAASDADVPVNRPQNLCISTECPAPYATCGTGYRCNTNLSNDSSNCGSCGTVCPTDFGYLNMTSACVNGTCEPACTQTTIVGDTWIYANCNAVLEDGCEINLSTDPNNCGGCGNECGDGVRCFDGKCGCPNGKMDCDGVCVDARNDDDNCGRCGNACQWPTDAGAPPNHMVYGCVEGECGKLKCEDFFGERYADCDGDQENGCEVYLGGDNSRIDPYFCGSCDNHCTAEQICSDTNSDYIPECSCTRSNETRCGSIEAYNLGCYDLLNDLENCGTCFHMCYAYTAHTTSACRKGVCEFDCEPGWGDCDLDPANGCETNLKSSDGHCGACGNRCDTQAGQPCIEGQCAMTECDAGGGPK